MAKLQPRICARCGKIISRKRSKAGQLEGTGAYKKRKYCSRACYLASVGCYGGEKKVPAREAVDDFDGRLLFTMRRASGLTQTELAALVGCTQGTVRQIEKGLIKNSKWKEKCFQAASAATSAPKRCKECQAPIPVAVNLRSAFCSDGCRKEYKRRYLAKYRKKYARGEVGWQMRALAGEREGRAGEMAALYASGTSLKDLAKKYNMCVPTARKILLALGATIRSAQRSAVDNQYRRRYMSVKRGAEVRNIRFEISLRWYCSNIAGKPCVYCGEPFPPSRSMAGWVDRVDSGGHYTEDNLVPCCTWCNKAKNTQSAREFVARCARVARGEGQHLTPP